MKGQGNHWPEAVLLFWIPLPAIVFYVTYAYRFQGNKGSYMMIAIRQLSFILPISCSELFDVSLGLDNPGPSCMLLIKTGTNPVASLIETFVLCC